MKRLLFAVGIGLCACGGEVAESPASGSPQSSQSPESSGRGGSTAGANDDHVADVEADPGDACSIARPGEAKALPAGVTVPAGAVGLQLEFELKDQRVELVGIRERGVAPAWTSKDTQTFAPDTTTGDWVETRDAAGALTYQRNVWDPLSRNIEAAPDPNDPNSQWKNTEVCSATASFRVEIPADAAEVRFYGNELSSRPTKLFAWYRLR